MTDAYVAECARSWWKKFIEPDHSAARAARARLRRTRTPQEAALEPPAVVLAKELDVVDDDWRLPMALNLAHVLAHVKEDSPRPLMRELGYRSIPTEKNKGDPP